LAKHGSETHLTVLKVKPQYLSVVTSGGAGRARDAVAGKKAFVLDKMHAGSGAPTRHIFIYCRGLFLRG
jgi:hypothetical protein